MNKAKDIINAVESARKIIITAHKSPDGDSIGSSLGLFRFLKSLGKDAAICHPDPCPNFLNWAKKEDVILDFESSKDRVTEFMTTADLIFSLDYNGAGRLGEEMGELLNNAVAKKIMTKHQQSTKAKSPHLFGNFLGGSTPT